MLEASRNFLLTAVVIAATLAIYHEYNIESCGTATHCGVPIHDVLHQVFG